MFNMATAAEVRRNLAAPSVDPSIIKPIIQKVFCASVSGWLSSKLQYRRERRAKSAPKNTRRQPRRGGSETESLKLVVILRSETAVQPTSLMDAQQLLLGETVTQSEELEREEPSKIWPTTGWGSWESWSKCLLRGFMQTKPVFSSGFQSGIACVSIQSWWWCSLAIELADKVEDFRTVPPPREDESPGKGQNEGTST